MIDEEIVEDAVIDEEIGPPLPLSLMKALELDEGLPLLPLLP